jgi:hypothetical protein
MAAVNPIDFCKTFAVAAARMCGAKSDQDGMAIALVCLQEGINFVEFGRRYHMIMGRPSMRSDAMLAEFRLNYGGDYEIKSRTPDLAAITFTDKRGRIYDCEFSWADAQESRWPWNDWEDHSKGLKDAWATPTDRKSMLFARLVSDSLRAICPELVSGIYTPEEMSDALEPARPTQQSPSPAVEQIIASTVTTETVVEDVQVVESEVTSESAVVLEDGEIVVQQEEVPLNLITSRQASKITGLVEKAGMSEEKYRNMLARRSVEKLEQLTVEQADEIIGRIESFIDSKK